MKRIKILVSGLLLSSTMMAAVVQTNGNNVTITPDGGQAKVVYLEVINNQIIRVRATSKDALPVKPASLIRVPVAAPAKGSYTITDEGDNVVVRTQKVKAVVQKATGQITFFDASGKQLLKEAQDVTSIALHPWCLIPLFFVVLTVLAFNFLGDGMRDAADPYK